MASLCVENVPGGVLTVPAAVTLCSSLRGWHCLSYGGMSLIGKLADQSVLANKITGLGRLVPFLGERLLLGVSIE